MTTTRHDGSRADAMTDEEIHAAALADPDAQPLTPERLERMKRTPQVKFIRRAVELTEEEFAERFRIPLGTSRDWEQGRKDPDAAARAYLVVIGRNPVAVSEALRRGASFSKPVHPACPGLWRAECRPGEGEFAWPIT